MSIHVGIFGPSLFGKSYVAKELARQYWLRDRRRSLVLDITAEPGENTWGPWALVFTDKALFWDAVWVRYKGCAVFADEAGDTIDRKKEANAFFTRIRHRFHVMHAIGHVVTDLTPKQRNQLGTLFLFWQTAEAAEKISREWSDSRLMETTRLPEYEFLLCQKHAANPGHLITRGRFPAPK